MWLWPRRFFFQKFVQLEAPVVSFQRIGTKDIAGVLIFGDDCRVGDIQIRLTQIAAVYFVQDRHGGGNIVGLIVKVIVHQRQKRVLFKQRVKAPFPIAPDDDNVPDPCRRQRVQQRLQNPNAVHRHQWLRAVGSGRHHPGSEPRSQDNRPFHPVGLQRGKPRFRNGKHIPLPVNPLFPGQPIQAPGNLPTGNRQRVRKPPERINPCPLALQPGKHLKLISCHGCVSSLAGDFP